MLVNVWKRVRVSSKSKPENADMTHNCLKAVLTIAQIVGNFPIDNVRCDEPNKLRFTFKSWKVLYAVLISLGYLVCCVFSFYKALTARILLNQLITPLYYFHSFFTSLLFIQLAYRWPRFMALWTKTEDHLVKNYKATTALYKRINFSVVIMILLSLLEHSLAIFSLSYSSKCHNDSIGAEHLFKKQFHYFFTYMPYHVLGAAVLAFLDWTATFVWNFGDIFIILMSMIMTERFRQINLKMKTSAEELVTSVNSNESSGFIKVYHAEFPKAKHRFWRHIREDYNNMSNVMLQLDQILSNLVVLSYSCNLTFILIQLFNSLRQMGSIVEAIYFFYSFGFVIARIVFVSIFGASINEESQAGLPHLTSLPTEFFNEEIQRLITQIHIDSVALTGHNLFRITKGLVLSVAAAIITYELVLIQFNQATLDKYMSANESICF